MATISQFGIPGIGTGINQPKLKHNWRVVFAGIGAEGTSSQPLSMQAISFTRPKLNFQKVELHRYNSRAYIASKHEWQPVELVLEDDVTGAASQVINDQVSKQQFLIGAEGPFLGRGQEGSIYKFAARVELLDGQEQVIERWILQGCFLEAIDWGDLAYSDGEAVTISTTISYDHAYQDTLSGYQHDGIALGGSGR